MITVPNKQKFIDALYKSGTITFPIRADSINTEVPYKTNFKKLSSYPHILKFTAQLLGEELKKEAFDLLAGPTRDIPLTTSISLEFNWPMVFVRPERKAYGMEHLIEGNFQPGQKVVVIDEEIIDISESLQLLGRIEGGGLKVDSIYVLFDREDSIKESFNKKGYRYFPLISLNDVLIHFALRGYIDETESKFLKKVIREEKRVFHRV